MTAIAYSVIATLPDAATLAEYLAWLKGHVDQVIAGGASRAEIVRIEQPGEPLQVEARYLFADRQRFEMYLQTAAPGLRAEGLARFPPERGVRFERRVGTVIDSPMSGAAPRHPAN
jgi:hypothetical protein